MTRAADGWSCRTIGACGRCSALRARLDASRRSTRLTQIDPWFLQQFRRSRSFGAWRRSASSARCRRPAAHAQAHGVRRRGDRRDLGVGEDVVRAAARREGSRPAYKRIDTCAAEFESFTPYSYGTYEQDCEADPTPGRRSSSSAAVRTGSGRASSSTTAAATPSSRCARKASRR